jgi:hypothetical protein
MPDMTANELKDHLREWMRKPTEDLKTHLNNMGVDTGIVRSKQALVKLHADHHGSAPLTGAEAVGATVKPEPAKAPAPKPARKAPAAKPATKPAPAKPAAKAPARKAPARKPATETAPKPPARKATAKPATKTTKPAPARRTPAKPAPKPASKAPAKAGKAPAPKPETNGSPSANASKHDLAKRLIDMVAAEFASETPENKAKLAYWLHGLPTGYPNGGGGGYLRYWPAGLPRPTTAGWRKPEGE